MSKARRSFGKQKFLLPLTITLFQYDPDPWGDQTVAPTPLKSSPKRGQEVNLIKLAAEYRMGLPETTGL